TPDAEADGTPDGDGPFWLADAAACSARSAADAKVDEEFLTEPLVSPLPSRPVTLGCAGCAEKEREVIVGETQASPALFIRAPCSVRRPWGASMVPRQPAIPPGSSRRHSPTRANHRPGPLNRRDPSPRLPLKSLTVQADPGPVRERAEPSRSPTVARPRPGS